MRGKWKLWLDYYLNSSIEQEYDRKNENKETWKFQFFGLLLWTLTDPSYGRFEFTVYWRPQLICWGSFSIKLFADVKEWWFLMKVLTKGPKSSAHIFCNKMRCKIISKPSARSTTRIWHVDLSFSCSFPCRWGHTSWSWLWP